MATCPFPRHDAFVAIAIACLLLAGHPGYAANWPQFRGPAASGVDDTRPLPTKWNISTGENIRWQTPIPGLAHASPIVWENRIYVATAVKPGEAELRTGLYGDITPLEEKEPHQWRLIAVDKASGKIIWNSLAVEAVPRVKRHPKATHCNSTPATDGKHIVEIFGSEGLFCFDPGGKLLWKKDLGPMVSAFFASPTAQWGFASSPIIHQGSVIVQCDVLTNSFIAAFNIEDGKELWRTRRTDVPTWSTPTVVQTPGLQIIIANGWHETAGYDFASGKRRWHLDGGGDIPVPTPIFAHGLVYLTSAHGKFRPLRAVRPDTQGDITPADPGQTNDAIVWAHARQGNYMQTPIVVRDLLFACQDNGLLSCLNAKTGEIKYSERLSSRGQGFTSSPVSDGRHLFIASEPGTVFIVPATDRFSIASTNEMNEACMSSPAISDGALYYRTQRKLLAIGPGTQAPAIEPLVSPRQ